MAIRELFARYEFSWNKGVLAQITAASQRVEARIRGVATGFNQAGSAALAAQAPLSASVQRASKPLSGVALLLDRVRQRFLRLWYGGGARVAFKAADTAIRGLVSPLLLVKNIWQRLFTRGGTSRAVAEIHRVEGAARGASGAVGGLGGALKNALAALGLFGGAFGAVFAGRAIVGGIRNMFKAVDNTAKLAKQLGITVEAMQSLDAAARLSGLSVEDLRVGLTTMTRNLGLFVATGEGRAVKVLEEMGAGIDDIKDRSPDQLFWQFGKALASIEDPVKRSAFAQRIFGESGAKMLSLFHGSAAEIEALKKRTEELGIVFDGKFAASVEKTNDEMYLAGLQFERIKVLAVGALTPALQWIASRLIHLGQAFGKVTGASNLLRASFLTGGWGLFVKLLGRLFGGVGGIRGALGKLWPALIKIGRLILPWIAWALIIDDITTFLEGGDSALGRFLDTLFGAGTAKAVLEDLRRRWAGIVEWLKKAGASVREWASTTDEGTKKALVAVAAFLLFASTGIGQLLIKMALLAAAWIVQIARAGAAATAWAAANVQALGLAAGMSTAAIAAGAMAAAVLAIVAAIDQYKKLLDEVGGIEGLKRGWETFTEGKGFFSGVDQNLNDQARMKAYGTTDPAKIRAIQARELAALKQGKGSGTRATPEPTLPVAAGGRGGNVTINDQRRVDVKVSRDATPAQTAKAVSGAVVKTQGADVRALRGALVGAEHG
jgi:hypothetical protein